MQGAEKNQWGEPRFEDMPGDPLLSGNDPEYHYTLGAILSGSNRAALERRSHWTGAVLSRPDAILIARDAACFPDRYSPLARQVLARTIQRWSIADSEIRALPHGIVLAEAL